MTKTQVNFEKNTAILMPDSIPKTTMAPHSHKFPLCPESKCNDFNFLYLQTASG
jgi:hypothetical protein